MNTKTPDGLGSWTKVRQEVPCESLTEATGQTDSEP